MRQGVNANLYELIANAEDPQVYVSAIIRERILAARDAPVLLVKSAAGPCKGMWHLPGGKLAHGVSTHDSLAVHLASQLGKSPTVRGPASAAPGQYMVAREGNTPLHVINLYYHADPRPSRRRKPRAGQAESRFCDPHMLRKMQREDGERFTPGTLHALERILGWDVDEDVRLTPQNVEETARRLATLVVTAVEAIGARRSRSEAARLASRRKHVPIHRRRSK